MNPNEIRVGNILKWEDESEDLVTVNGLHYDTQDSMWWMHYIQKPEVKEDEDLLGVAMLDEFVGIPLTEEWLIELGFNKTAFSKRFICEGLFPKYF